jgi:O-antigen/teichoic acid export membrane protein
MAAPGYNICLGLGRPELPAIVSFASAFLMILLVFILAPPFGLTGAAIANLVYSLAYVVNGYVAHVLGLKRVSFITKSIGPPIFVLLTVYLIISIGNYKLISLIITALISFIALLWMAINELSGNVLYTKR